MSSSDFLRMILGIAGFICLPLIVYCMRQEDSGHFFLSALLGGVLGFLIPVLTLSLFIQWGSSGLEVGIFYLLFVAALIGGIVGAYIGTGVAAWRR